MGHIDHDTISTYVQGDEELLGELATIFVQSLPDCAARLRYSSEQEDAMALSDAAHQLKGRLSYFGARSLQQQAHRLEQCGKDSHLTVAPALAEELIDGIEEMLSELRGITGLSLEPAYED